MTDEDEELLQDLLLEWEESYVRGQESSSGELCREHPHLVEELARRIAALKATAWLNDPDCDVGDPTLEQTEAAAQSARILVGRYQLEGLIAEGGFGQVWRAYDSELQRIVAIKIPKASRLASADGFMAEARRVARLKHPGIVPVFDVGVDGAQCFIVSEFIEGGSLSDRLFRNPPSLGQAIQWIAEIADALEYAHLHGVIHRDIKPANILIDHHSRALLADFGIAQSAMKTGVFAPSLGTLRYMSPEQLDGRAVTPASDVFSLALVLHETLTGKLPYSSDQPQVVRKEIGQGVAKTLSQKLPPQIRAVCEKALQREPHRRHASAAHFARDVRAAKPLEKRSGRWLKWSVAVALGVLVACVIIGLLWAGAIRSSREAGEKAVRAIPSPFGKMKQIQERLSGVSGVVESARQLSDDVAHTTVNASEYDRRGAALFNEKQYRESLAAFDEAVALEPGNPTFRQHRALAYVWLKEFDKALTDLQQALQHGSADRKAINDQLATVYGSRAVDSAQQGRQLQAIEDLTKAISLAPTNGELLDKRGSCYYNVREYEKALLDFDAAIELLPRKSEFYLHRGYCRHAMGMTEMAEEDLAAAEKLAGTN